MRLTARKQTFSAWNDSIRRERERKRELVHIPSYFPSLTRFSFCYHSDSFPSSLVESGCILLKITLIQFMSCFSITPWRNFHQIVSFQSLSEFVSFPNLNFVLFTSSSDFSFQDLELFYFISPNFSFHGFLPMALSRNAPFSNVGPVKTRSTYKRPKNSEH